LVLAALTVIALSAWAYMAYAARAMYHTGLCCCAGMEMSGPDVNPWSAATLAPLFLMWAEMMIAMMIPTATPMILTFALVNRKRRESERPFVPTGVFLAGYLAVWSGFSVLAALAQWYLHARSLLSPLMVSNSRWLGGILLIAAGIFQWLPLKRTCLAHCRSPLDFLMHGWREGQAGAFLMGLRHGAYCTGCCWLLMALLFVAGVMNLWWIALITLLVLVEKAAPRGLLIGRVAGALLVAWGVGMLWKWVSPNY
jgi:predicted metal-binding membrane protein